jgi:selenocysteine lyase/cysteine desulfurase
VTTSPPGNYDIIAVRSAYPVLDEVTYLNIGTYGVMPDPALKTFIELETEFERKGAASTMNLGAMANDTRERIAKLVGANAKEIAFTRNATDGINLVLAGLTWQPGDEVITTTQEHEAINHPLLYLAATKGIIVRRFEPTADGAEAVKRIEAVASARTRLIALSHVTCETGTRLPARQICEWATAHNVLSLLDCAQSLGAFGVNVREIGCDYLTSNGHKWLCGPKGTGVFYGKLDKLVQLNPAHVGAGSLAWVDLTSGAAEAWASGLRFEYGTRATALFAGLGASLDWFDGLGWANVYGHIAALSDYAKRRISERPHLQLLSPQAFEASSGLVVFKAPGNVCHEIGRALREKYKIVVRLIPHYNAVRVTTAHFNNEADIDKLVLALDEIIKGS